MTIKKVQFAFAAMLAAGTISGLMFVGGCGSSSNSSGSPGPSLAPAIPTPRVTILIPVGASTLGTVAYGTNPLDITPQNVVWVNNDSTPHSATSDTGIWDTGVIQPGATSSPIPFQSPGSFPYGSTVAGDAGMSGEIAVGSPSPSPSPSPSASPSPAATVAATIPAGATGMGAMGYSPDPLTIAVGTTVVWTNADSVAHTVTANDNSFNSGPIQPGATFSHVFSTAGTFPYYCTIHGQASMNGTVIVQ